MRLALALLLAALAVAPTGAQRYINSTGTKREPAGRRPTCAHPVFKGRVRQPVGNP